MSDIIGYAGALTADGTPIAELFADQGDGTYALVLGGLGGDPGAGDNCDGAHLDFSCPENSLWLSLA